MKNYCCKQFGQEIGRYRAPAGGGFYPSTMAPDAQIEPDSDGTWNVNGCCGGGCFVLTGMRFCPFCGEGIEGRFRCTPATA
ncbi:hypothetical protein [Methylopila sp. M107]|uniref:hypothetical protein n=1 Tax=Methylopila sp. M107 TaxID=1101190 RepID=UPI0012DBF13F|nr:hypothetical protein [Methylopila sp. M107]